MANKIIAFLIGMLSGLIIYCVMKLICGVEDSKVPEFKVPERPNKDKTEP